MRFAARSMFRVRIQAGYVCARAAVQCLQPSRALREKSICINAAMCWTAKKNWVEGQKGGTRGMICDSIRVKKSASVTALRFDRSDRCAGIQFRLRTPMKSSKAVPVLGFLRFAEQTRYGRC
jgi:hypothetical protein